MRGSNRTAGRTLERWRNSFFRGRKRSAENFRPDEGRVPDGTERRRVRQVQPLEFGDGQFGVERGRERVDPLCGPIATDDRSPEEPSRLPVGRYRLGDRLVARRSRLLEIDDSGSAALDVLSDVNATSAERPAEAIRPTRTVTLALSKTGLLEVSGRSRA